MEIDRAALADFLRRRREALQPEDVGLPRGVRRRTSGLRREEVAALAHMSTDYYTRLETARGPQPSSSMIQSIAHALHLARAERDHLLRLAGHAAPAAGVATDHVSPGMRRIVDRLVDTPAEVVTELGETLLQTPLGVVLTGDASQRSGSARSLGYRWFTDPETRERYAPDDHEHLSRLFASGLREVAALRGAGSRATRLAEELRARSPEFRELWERHEVGLVPAEVKRLRHPEVGVIELACQTLIDPDQAHRLLVYTAVPGSESAEKLRLLAVFAPPVVSAPGELWESGLSAR